MAKSKDSYTCSECGTIYAQWKGQCSTCASWNTLQLTTTTNSPSHIPSTIATALPYITAEKTLRISTNIKTLDSIFGDGIVPGSSLLLGGEPGIGKSTFVLQLASLFAKQNHTVVYVSGEESITQISLRAQRLDINDETIFLLSTSSLQDIFNYITATNPKPSVLIMDSVQTLTTNTIEGFAGNVNQVKSVASECIDFCKQYNIAVIFIGHITKEGSLAGPKVLEHLVDAVLSFDGDRKQVFRILRVIKNRFGSTQELGVFQMEEKGLKLIEDPSTYFLEERDPSLSGTALVMITEGQIAFAVEVQALVTRSYASIPRRIALGYDSNRLILLLAVMEKRLRCNFAELDIHTKIGGGLRSNDPAIDLALVVAILSSMYDIPLPERSIVWGEVDLNGQVRPVTNHELRHQQATKLGYTPVIAPKYKHTGITSLNELGFLFKKEKQ